MKCVVGSCEQQQQRRAELGTTANVLDWYEQSGAMDVRSFHLFVIVLILGGFPLVSADPLCSNRLCNNLEESKKEDTLVQHETSCSQDPLSDFEFDENCLIQSTLIGPVRGFRQISAASNSDVDVFLGVSLTVTF